MENKKRCLYERLENGIHQFVFTESSNAAVDEWIEWLNVSNTQQDTAPEGDTDRILFDTLQCGALPMYYAFKKLNEWQREHPSLDQTRKTRTAQLYNTNTFYATMARNLMKVFPVPTSKMEYFHNDREGAIAWLLSDD